MAARITMVSPNLGAGGAERVMLNLMAEFVSRGLDVDLLLMRREGELLEQVPEPVSVIDLGGGRPRQIIRPMRRHLIARRPDAVLTAHSSLNWAACLATRLARIDARCVVREENTLSAALARLGWTTRWLRPMLLRRACGGCHHVAVSKGAAADFRRVVGLSDDRVSAIYNPVIDARLLQKARERVDHPWFKARIPVIVAVGRLQRAKGFDVLLEAFARLIQRRAARLLILGEGPERQRLEILRTRLGLDDSVAMPGFVGNPYPYMRCADVFVLSSRWEGLANVLIEALACGARVVATDCPHGPREILDGGRFGVLAPMENPEALADGICATLDGEVNAEDPADWLRQFEVAGAAQAHLELMGLA